MLEDMIDMVEKAVEGVMMNGKQHKVIISAWPRDESVCSYLVFVEHDDTCVCSIQPLPVNILSEYVTATLPSIIEVGGVQMACGVNGTALTFDDTHNEPSECVTVFVDYSKDIRGDCDENSISGSEKHKCRSTMPITSSTFYSKRRQYCAVIPANNIESDDGNSSSDEGSECRWGSPKFKNDIIVPASEPSESESDEPSATTSLQNRKVECKNKLNARETALKQRRMRHTRFVRASFDQRTPGSMNSSTATDLKQKKVHSQKFNNRNVLKESQINNVVPATTQEDHKLTEAGDGRAGVSRPISENISIEMSKSNINMRMKTSEESTTNSTSPSMTKANENIDGSSCLSSPLSPPLSGFSSPSGSVHTSPGSDVPLSELVKIARSQRPLPSDNLGFPHSNTANQQRVCTQKPSSVVAPVSEKSKKIVIDRKPLRKFSFRSTKECSSPARNITPESTRFARSLKKQSQTPLNSRIGGFSSRNLFPNEKEDSGSVNKETGMLGVEPLESEDRGQSNQGCDGSVPKNDFDFDSTNDLSDKENLENSPPVSPKPLASKIKSHGGNSSIDKTGQKVNSSPTSSGKSLRKKSVVPTVACKASSDKIQGNNLRGDKTVLKVVPSPAISCISPKKSSVVQTVVSKPSSSKSQTNDTGVAESCKEKVSSCKVPSRSLRSQSQPKKPVITYDSSSSSEASIEEVNCDYSFDEFGEEEWEEDNPEPKSSKGKKAQPSKVIQKKSASKKVAVAKPSKENAAAKKQKGQGNRNPSVWKIGDLPETVLGEAVFTEPDEVKTPCQYFRLFFDSNVLNEIVEQTNLYTAQKNGSSIGMTSKESEAFIGIMIYMGIARLPASEDYWKLDTRVEQVAKVLPFRRFKKLRSSVHFADNDGPPNDDRFRKIRPLMNHIREKCKSLEQENHHSIDESMVPYKGTRAGNLRQYVKNKPHKWGFKFFMRAGISGIIYDFVPYSGSQTFDSEELSDYENEMGVGAQAVISLCKSIPNPRLNLVVFDNWFSGLPLVEYLKDNMYLLSLGTVRKNRIDKCPLKSDKDLEKEGRGAFDFRVNEKGVIVIKWHDNNCVHVASTFAGVEPLGNASRFSKEAKAKVAVPCPKAISVYNHNMGGVDTFDHLVQLYRLPNRARRWYFGIFTFLIDLALVNSWLLYRRDCSMLQKRQEDFHPEMKCSKQFRLHVSAALTGPEKRKGRPSVDSVPVNKRIKPSNMKSPRPVADIRYDGVEHWPVACDKARCRFCKTRYTRFKCHKCDMALCLYSGKNCFVDFHKKTAGENLVN